MLTARAATRPMVSSETSDCTPHRLGTLAERHRVGGAEGSRRGQRHEQVVDEPRLPARRRGRWVAVLREPQVREAHRSTPGPAQRSAPVQLPVIEPEHQHVGHPHTGGRPQQLPAVDRAAAQQPVHERDQRYGVDGADCQDHYDGKGSQVAGLPADPRGVRCQQPDQQQRLEAGQQQWRPRDQPVGEEDLNQQGGGHCSRGRPTGLPRLQGTPSRRRAADGRPCRIITSTAHGLRRGLPSWLIASPAERKRRAGPRPGS